MGNNIAKKASAGDETFLRLSFRFVSTDSRSKFILFVIFFAAGGAASSARVEQTGIRERTTKGNGKFDTEDRTQTPPNVHQNRNVKRKYAKSRAIH